MNKKNRNKPKKPNLFTILKPYKKLIVPLVILALLSNGLTLWLPRLISHGIDGFFRNGSIHTILWQFSIAAICIFILTYVQNILQTITSEQVARDVRNTLSEKISRQSVAQVQKITPATLLTNLTSDIDAIKNFVSQAIVNVVSSLFLIIGGSTLLISINWKLGLAVLIALPLIGTTFFFILKKVRVLFLKTREVIDWLNRVINESIMGAALIRVLHSQSLEHQKFSEANKNAHDIGINILKLFSAMIPIITFTSNLTILIILTLGGKFVIGGTMTLGEFASFNSYMAILIFPILILGFVSNIIAQAQASYGRIAQVLSAPDVPNEGTNTTPLQGNIQLEDINLLFGEKAALKDVSLNITAGSKVAIIGPTAAGKTQLMSLLIGLLPPTSGQVLYDNIPLNEYQKEALYKQVGLVFQDSILFNVSVRENIAFNTEVREDDVQKAIETAELSNFIHTLPQGMETIVSERGASLSGGQKQRIMLARALAINPHILLLDDFTARVDTNTEQKILANIAKNYPHVTLVSVTQKIASVEHYDQIIVLMEGEVLARGTHEHLLKTSPEYIQMYRSQQSTNTI
ncbi:ABC transporter ATP-binding protein [Candidatus Parcubacteria bacterium]|uniref:ABC transporter ATP-binding protein n=1 Tax=Candidatus Magasanikbacteria bacterium CG10_big_fil_rev_8_21_14_0_10_38_6 TaxID=1974647 RepID=A0A2M6P0T9_9BACT|nr:ABC transporter ATP-binding protein [Candidatus Parcubacteria bacterium]PIR77317.1 MAG: ABC transporter ATP-binding protein [Candidatus Magasanikbacteria bacterium CG10_big_fil_rev_8_21_14_0_10_38_6]